MNLNLILLQPGIQFSDGTIILFIYLFIYSRNHHMIIPYNNLSIFNNEVIYTVSSLGMQ